MNNLIASSAKTMLPVAIALTIGAGVGYWFSPATSVVTESEIDTTQTNINASTTGTTGNTTGSTNSPTLDTVTTSPGNAPEASPLLNHQEGSFTPEYDNPASTMSNAIDHLMALSDSKDSRLVAESLQQVLNLATQDTQALTTLIDAFNNNVDGVHIKDNLLQVLAEINDPEVEQLALDLAQSSDRDTRISGLDLLAELNIPSEETLRLTTDVLWQNQDDPEMLLSALNAVPDLTLPQEQNTQVLTLFNTLSKNDDDGVRSASLFAIASHAKNTNELEPVLQALNSNIGDDKISAAMALEQSPVTSLILKNTFFDKMTDETELWEVRTMAANSLGRFSLNATDFSILSSFREQQTADINY